jgi:hypothetical protein
MPIIPERNICLVRFLVLALVLVLEHARNGSARLRHELSRTLRPTPLRVGLSSIGSRRGGGTRAPRGGQLIENEDEDQKEEGDEKEKEDGLKNRSPSNPPAQVVSCNEW